jgi:acyl-CoA thioester hydrolase
MMEKQGQNLEGNTPQASLDVPVRVRFAETDLMGIVHHANYLVYFELARIEFSRQAGMPYAELEGNGYSLTVSEVNIRYGIPARFDQEIIIRIILEAVQSRGIEFSYQVLDAQTQKRLTTGNSKVICIDHSGQVRRLPDAWRQRLERLLAAQT